MGSPDGIPTQPSSSWLVLCNRHLPEPLPPLGHIQRVDYILSDPQPKLILPSFSGFFQMPITVIRKVTSILLIIDKCTTSQSR